MSVIICSRCKARFDGNGRYCPDCKPVIKDTLQAKQRDRVYGSARWRKVRNMQLRKFPLCAMCLVSGRVTPAVIADHIKEIRDGGSVHSLDNLQSLCASCHAIKTARARRARAGRAG